MASVYAGTHVVKRMSPTQPGALKLARRYGDALVCVRYRHDAQGQHRYTTVELVVDDAPVKGTANLDEIVSVFLPFSDAHRRQLVLNHGASWNAKSRLWSMSRRIAKKLRLAGRIVKP